MDPADAETLSEIPRWEVRRCGPFTDVDGEGSRRCEFRSRVPSGSVPLKLADRVGCLGHCLQVLEVQGRKWDQRWNLSTTNDDILGKSPGAVELTLEPTAVVHRVYTDSGNQYLGWSPSVL